MSDYMKKGIDISYCQTRIDWNKLDVDFVIMRAGYGREVSQKDTMFESHYANAKQRGIPCGCYWYSYAMDVEGAKKEAQACLEVIKGKQFEYPIFFDLEENKQFALGKEKVSEIMRTFIETVEAAGYWVGLYGSYSSLMNYTSDYIRTNKAIWLAHWGVQKSPYPYQYGTWQYAVGRIDGVYGDCDLDYCYVDYPTLIINAGLNGFKKPQDNVEPTTPTYPEPTRTLKEGDSGEDVKWLQDKLKNKGYYIGEISGKFDVITLGAVLAFQKKSGLVVDGLAGTKTRNALKK